VLVLDVAEVTDCVSSFIDVMFVVLEVLVDFMLDFVEAAKDSDLVVVMFVELEVFLASVLVLDVAEVAVCSLSFIDVMFAVLEVLVDSMLDFVEAAKD
jgi:hypothetical protein